MSQKIVDESHDENARSCHVLSVALSNIIKNSVNADFRNRCFEVLRTDSSFGARAVLMESLLSVVSKKRSEETGKDDKKTVKNVENKE
ncbi:hypothetical protein P5V15_011038 [Pogonomyrmex californicus]